MKIPPKISHFPPKTQIPKIAINLVKKELVELRNWDVRAGQKPDVIISNSDFVSKRIKQKINLWLNSSICSDNAISSS